MTEPEEHWRQDADRLFAELEVEATPLPFCPVVLLDGTQCLLPLVDERHCRHRGLGPAPEALGELVTELRRDLAEAREIAGTLAALARYLRGDKAVDIALRRLRLGPPQPAWLRPDAEWPPP